MRLAAIENFARFNHLNSDNASHDDVVKSSAGVLGMSFAGVRAWNSFDPPVPPVTIDNVGSCSSIARELAREKVAVAHRISDKTVRFMFG